MSQIIAGTYELIRELGSGGGGIVYLGEHLRLKKPVVLKADKRSLSASPESLRQEVDALKSLSHTYIPQVYDFVVENGMVYTVMDFIEGESLDKPLARGERFPQAQIIEWACQLLEALCYLHSRPPHGILHSDIKPANIMRTPQNDIRLIDFNIALALGEEGAVRVGFSRGYASPEHYGIDYSGVERTQEISPQTMVIADPGRTIVDRGSSSRSGRTVLLDVRSDIYSLGATLYHLLTGIRPSQDALQVAPVSTPGVSPAVAAIIQKAMAPDPSRRYQTAAEMLYAFEHLHETDPRARRHRKHTAAAAAVLAAVFLSGGLCSFAGLRQMEQAQQAARLEAEAEEAAQRTAREALSLIGSSEQALDIGNPPSAIALAVRALELDSPYQSRAQKALTDALGVYALSDGFQPHLAVELPSEPIKLALSPAGTRAAVLTSGMVTVVDTRTGARLAELPANSSALSGLAFPGEDILLYAGETALTAFDLEQGRPLWSGEPATGIALSGDGSTVAAVYKGDGRAFLYDRNGALLRTVDFEGKRQRIPSNDRFLDPGDALLELDDQGKWLAASFEDGSLRIFDLSGDGNDWEIFDRSAYTHFEGGFCGSYFAFSAIGQQESVFAVMDLETRSQTGGFSSTMPFHVQADGRGIYVSTEDVLVKLDPVTGEQAETAYTGSKDITAFSAGGACTVALDSEGTAVFFDGNAKRMEEYPGGCDLAELAEDTAILASRDAPRLRILRLERHPESLLAVYDGDYPHDEARVGADGETMMLFRYNGFRLYREGALLAEVAIPNAEQVYDQQYRREGTESYLDVIYNSGLIRRYSATDGALLSEIAGAPPDETLYEEFLTERLRITSPLHGTPAAYDRESGELIRELEQDAYLTYVTQVGESVITEYVTVQGERYGLLLNGQCETLAYLPDLCDVLADGTLVFDDRKGNLRQSRIYSIQELIALGKNS